jgi:predicted ATPase/class 3 adenylate cyclase
VGAPSGTVTFLFTDIEGSTRLWQQDEEVMRVAVARHDELLREVVRKHGGWVFSSSGDGLAAAFSSASSAVAAALAAQGALAAEAWPPATPIRVRMGLHTGEAERRDEDYFGSAVNRAARLMAVGSGGQVLCSAATAGLVEGEVALVNLGEHRLRDLDRPMRVFQLGEQRFPPLRSLDSFPGNLPLQLSSFIGREHDVERVASALVESRSVTLTGVGGVGKTRLALQVAAEVVPRFAHGAWLVELGGLTDPDGLEGAVAAALGVGPQPFQELGTTLLNFIRERRMLLLLDNCEHLLDAAARFADRALRDAAELTVLATSREALGLAGERVCGVPPLELPSSAPGAAPSEACASVALFVDRARAARAEFALGQDTWPSVAQICARLDGIPLAIELAAARIRSMGAGEILQRLDQRFQLLTGGMRQSADRHQTLRRAIDWSYDLLTPAEQTLLQRLAVCAGGFDLAAAEAIGPYAGADRWETDDLLARLVERSLVVLDDAGRRTRYRMLETIRDYAVERLVDARGADDARAAHAEYFARFAQVAGAGLRGADEVAWVVAIERELDNLDTAIRWSAGAGRESLALRMVFDLDDCDGVRTEPAVCAWAQVASSAPSAEHDPCYPAALAVITREVVRRGELERAEALAEQALAAAPGGSHLADRVRCRTLTARTFVSVIKASGDETLLQEWLTLGQQLDDRYELAHALLNLAGARMYEPGRDPGRVAGEALSVARQLGKPSTVAFALAIQGFFSIDANPAQALALIDEGLALAVEIGNDYVRSMAVMFRAAAAGRLEVDPIARMVLRVQAVRSALARGEDAHAATPMLWLAALFADTGLGDETAALLHAWGVAIIGDRRLDPGYRGIHAETFTSLQERLGEARYAELKARALNMSAADLLKIVGRQHPGLTGESGGARAEPPES